MSRRRLLPIITALAVALTTSGCHEAFCGESDGFDWVFELVGGVYRCEEVPEEPKPWAMISLSPEPALEGERVSFDGSSSTPSEGQIESYAWDFDADGRFDDATGARAEWTFETSGAHSVALRIRDSEGKRGRTQLSVLVLDPGEANDPIAALDVDKSFVAAGDTVTFDPSRSRDPDGRIVEYSWDPEGTGYNFHSTAASPRQHTYLEPGTYTARLRVTDDDGLTGVAEQIISVATPAGGVTADFEITPNPARPDQLVTFDASTSQGDIATYEWDLDGIGGYERTTTTPTTTHLYEGEASPGDTRDIGLRVANEHRTALATATVELVFTETAGTRASASAAGRRFSARLEGATFGRHDGVARRSGGRLSIKRRVLVGRMRGRVPGRGAADPLAGYLRATWLARLSMKARLGSPLVTLRGLAYARFERAPGSACLRLRLRARGRRRTGTLVALGGTGDGATLAHRATFRWRFTRRGGVALRGRIRGGRRPARPPGRACASLRRLRP